MTLAETPRESAVPLSSDNSEGSSPPDAVTLFTRFAPRIAALPDHERLTRADLLIPDFLLEQDARLAIYYAPFDYINPQARIVLIGITPGFQQMEIALRASRDALRRGTPIPEIVGHVKYQASFAGPIRKFLIAMLDGIGLSHALGIATCAALYADRADLLQTSAVVRYPVFVGGKDWTGHTPPARSNPLLRRYLTGVMLPELHAVPDALILSLGKCASDALAAHIATGALDPARCLIGLPHPSGANGHRFTQFAAVRDDLTTRVAAWFATTETSAM